MYMYMCILLLVCVHVYMYMAMYNTCTCTGLCNELLIVVLLISLCFSSSYLPSVYQAILMSATLSEVHVQYVYMFTYNVYMYLRYIHVHVCMTTYVQYM